MTTGSRTARPPRLRRPRRGRLLGVVGLVLAVVLLCCGLYWGNAVYRHPRVDPVSADTRVDAVLAIGGTIPTARYAAQLVSQGVAPELVLSNPYHRPNFVTQTCEHPPAGYRLTCFRPRPGTTRGEAEETARLVQQRGWQRVLVIAPTFHVARARLIFGRCVRPPTQLLVAQLPRSYPPLVWAEQYAYQTGGFVKAAILRGC